MDFYFGISLLFLVGFVLVCRTATTFVHEFGHGLAALLVTQGPVIVYVGSMGDAENGRQYQIGRLKVFHRFSFWHSRGGLCVPGYTDSLSAQAFYVLMGPLASVLVSIGIIFLTLQFEWHDISIILAFVFLASSIFDLWINLSPSFRPIRLANGQLTYNDGQLLKQIFKNRNYSVNIRRGFHHYEKRQYKEALELLEQAYATGERQPGLLNSLLHLYFAMSEGEKGLTFYHNELAYFNNLPESRHSLGVFYGMTAEYSKAMETFAGILYGQVDDVLVRVNRGFTLNLMGRYQEAIIDLDQALVLGGHDAYAYSNRAFSHVRLGNLKDAKADLALAMELEPDGSYGYLTEGIIHLQEGNKVKACASFERAKQLDPYTFSLDEYLAKACANLAP
jgi:Flp pilus assembly protein TadD